MNTLNIDAYLGKKEGDQLDHSDWNSVLGMLQNKVNELVESFNDHPTGGSKDSGDSGEAAVLKVDGKLYYSSPKNFQTVTLMMGKDYEISGKLYGQVVVNNEISIDGEDISAPLRNTCIRLNGVTIISSENYGILYDVNGDDNTGWKDLVITLDKDSVNHVVCLKEEQPSSDQPGAIYSENNLTLQGEGYLSVVNLGGHGIRGSEVKMAGPRMYIEASHDGIHGKNIDVYDGVFHVGKANDAFGTGENGRILWVRGRVYASMLSGKCFDSKKRGYYVEKPADSSGLFPIGSGYSADDENPGDYGTGEAMVVTYATKADMEANINPVYPPEVSDTNLGADCYDIQLPYVVLRGVFRQTATFYIPDTEDVNIYLKGAYIHNTEDCPLIYYVGGSSNKGRVKIVAEKDTVNMLLCEHADETATYDADVIKSENNISVEVKNGAVLYISDNIGDGLDGGDVKITDSKGSLVISNCGGRGIKGNAVVIGPEAEISKSVITNYPEYVEDKETGDDVATTVIEGIVVVKGNCQSSPESVMDAKDDNSAASTGFADIYCRQGKKVAKGVFGTTDRGLPGVLLTGSMAATIELDLGNARNLYYNRQLTGNLVHDCGRTYANYSAVPLGKAPLLDD